MIGPRGPYRLVSVFSSTLGAFIGRGLEPRQRPIAHPYAIAPIAIRTAENSSD
jgi:hypothetical protein